MHVRYFLALLISLVAHGLLFVQWTDSNEQTSSKGSAHVLLLEDNARWQTSSPELSTLKSKPVSPVKPHKNGEQKSIKTNQDANQPQSEKQTAQSTQTGQDQDLSGKAPDATSRYRNKVVKHLLNQMQEAPTLGEVQVKIWLMPSGIAFKIHTQRTNATVQYEQWVKTKVLSANPYPPIPKEVSRGNLELEFVIQHQADQ